MTSLVFLLGLVLPAFAQNPVYQIPNRKVDLHDPKLVTARQSCANWGLAAGLEALLAYQKVTLDQTFWVMRFNYGEICVDKIPSIDSLTQTVNQEFTLEDGGHVRLELRFVAGAPRNIDDVLARLKNDQLSLMIWRGHPYYLVGATYDENVRRDGARSFQVKEFRLADTFAKQPDATFQKGRDDPNDIDGILTVRATPL